MVSAKEKFPHLENGDIDLDAWLAKVKETYHLENTDLLEKASHLALETSKGLTTFYGQPCLEKGMEMATIILDLKLDQEAVASALLISIIQQSKLSLDVVSEKLNPTVAKLIRGVQQLDSIHGLERTGDDDKDQIQIDRLRKLLMAMVSDIRVVIVKLAERTCILRGIKNINPIQRKQIAQETMDIYAPLANRLGIGQLKWELEDVSFHYVDPETYKKIAKFLVDRRHVREERIEDTIQRLKNELQKANIHAEITGRAKHIYSIYLKTRRKDVDYHNIYDFSAVRILVPTVEDCYSALSIVHHLWTHIPAEFDDYITTPKPNGYRSIHTAVIGSDGNNLEIQIRTNAMHEEAERGVAAHWLYKEAKTKVSDYENKISTLRQLIDWHRDVAKSETKTEENSVYDQILSDRVYVFTPAGEILDLPQGATPLDCAYHIHSEVGNHCRGAKVNGHIVQLTYHLKTGEQIEILTQSNATPSRDWLNAEFGYLNTPRARAKVAHWFRTLDLNQHVESGKKIIEKEFSRAGSHFNIQKIAHKLGFKDEEALFISLGRGITRAVQITHLIESDHESHKEETAPVLISKKHIAKPGTMTIAGVDDLLTRIALCCKPIPGDKIVGFITQGRGVTIHKLNCNNITFLPETESNRLIAVSWDTGHAGSYYVDLQIKAHARENLLRELANFFANAKVTLISLNSTMNRSRNMTLITLTLQIDALLQLNQILSQIRLLPGVIEAKRLRDS